MAESYRRSNWSNALFIAPFMVLFAAFLVFPLFWGGWRSLHKADIFGPSRFVGMRNYVRVLSDPVLLQALRNTFVFVAVTVPIMIALGLFLALALNRQTRLALALRGLFFSSSILSVTIVTLIWRFVFIPALGLLPLTMTKLGLEPIDFLSLGGAVK